MIPTQMLLIRITSSPYAVETSSPEALWMRIIMLSQRFMTTASGIPSFLFKTTPRISKPPEEALPLKMRPEPIPSNSPARMILEAVESF